MSKIYIPELMELDSYWQKAVEDAIRDTLKDEKKLHYALRNRKIINQKLENLGLKHVHSQMSFSGRPPSESESIEDQEGSDSDSSERSSNEGKSKEVDPDERRSTSTDNRDPPFGEKPKNPERPLLGNGSLEKMKKSQNSFNCEPMGMENLNEELSESEKEENMDYDLNCNEIFQDDRDKKVQWLHVRDESDFDGSDAESAKDGPEDEESEENAALRSDESYFENKNSNLRLSHKLRKRKNSNIQQNINSQEDLIWEKGLKNAVKKNPDSERKLQMALVKRDIFKKNLKESRTGWNIPMEANLSTEKTAENRKRDKKYVTPFIKFYLELHRELGHKYSTAQITREATRRWRAMNKAQKSDYINSMHAY